MMRQAALHLREIAVSDLIIGSETLSYILDSGRICAIVRRQAPDLTYIRVLIKTMERMHFQQLQQGAASNLYVDDADCGSNAIDDVGAYMANAQKADKGELSGQLCQHKR